MKERKLNRKIGFDYSSEGYYHVVICTKNREMKFGSISNNKMNLNQLGIISNKYIQRIPKHNNATIDRFQIMPNHIHLLIKKSTMNATITISNGNAHTGIL